MDFKELETFLTIVEKGSISAAAAALGVSQPAVSKRVARLEEEMEAVLFAPGHKHCNLTNEGEAFLRGAQKLLELRRRMKNEVAQQSLEVSGQVKIAASTTPGELLLPPLLADFHRQYPAVHLSVRVSDSQEALSAMAERHVDLAVIGQEKSLPGHRLQPVFNDELVVVLPKWHPLARRNVLTFAELEGVDMVGRLAGSGTQSLWEKEYRNWSGTPKDTPLTFGSATALINAVAAGAGVGVVSKLAATQAGDRVAWVPLRPQVHRRFFMVRAQCERRAVEALATYIAEQAAAQEQAL